MNDVAGDPGGDDADRRRWRWPDRRAPSAQPLPTARSDLAYSYAPLVKRVSPAVVNIYTTTTARVQRRLPFPFPGMPQAGERVQNSLGSGVLVRPDGLIVTNAHVVKGADEIRVVLADRREFEAKLVTQDERYDLALLRIDGGGEKFPFLEMRDSDSIEVGDVVLAIGNPFGLNQTVTSGIISALARSAGGINDSSFFIQTDAAINPGNSGGALVSLDGRLIGINTAIYSQTGGSVGIGFATPSNIVARMVAIGEQGGRIVRPWLGINMQRVTPDLAAGFGLPRPAGLVVKEVFPDGPGATAGLKRNDVIVALRDQPIDDEASLRFRLATLQVDDDRAGARHPRRQGDDRSSMKLAAPPEDPPRERSRARRPPAAVRRHRGQHVARRRRRAGPRRMAAGRHRRRGEAGLLRRPLRAAGRHDPGDQRPGREERRRPQEAHRRRRVQRQRSAARAWYPPSSSAEAW